MIMKNRIHLTKVYSVAVVSLEPLYIYMKIMLYNSKIEKAIQGGESGLPFRIERIVYNITGAV